MPKVQALVKTVVCWGKGDAAAAEVRARRLPACLPVRCPPDFFLAAPLAAAYRRTGVACCQRP